MEDHGTPENTTPRAIQHLHSEPSDLSQVNSLADLAEVSNPPLVLLSSRVRSPGALVSCVNPGVVVVK